MTDEVLYAQLKTAYDQEQENEEAVGLEVRFVRGHTISDIMPAGRNMHFNCTEYRLWTRQFRLTLHTLASKT